MSDSESNLPGQDTGRCPAEVRAAIRVQASHGLDRAGTTGTHGTKPANPRWRKGRQEGGSAETTNREEPSARVPARDKQAEEDLWQRYKAERGVWTEPMLAALERGLEGNKWFSLIDKVSKERTLQLAWEKVLSNAGACGVDGITVDRFAKDSQNRLLVVNEHIKADTYQLGATTRKRVPPGLDRQTWQRGKATVGSSHRQSTLLILPADLRDRLESPIPSIL